jgi:hypothetical protein
VQRKYPCAFIYNDKEIVPIELYGYKKLGFLQPIIDIADYNQPVVIGIGKRVPINNCPANNLF